MGDIGGDPVEPEVRAAILEKIRGVEAAEGVRVLFAVESGSRAWGFPSPDSDYDARFVYARPVDGYLSIAPSRDVIELPIENDLDINGWDLRKALALLLKANPVLLEWLSSPIRYRWDDAACGRLRDFSKRVAHQRACLHHYLGLGEGNFARNIDGREVVSLKKYFYVLRPAMAVRWVRMRPETSPPMNFQQLVAGVALPAALTQLIEELLERKRIAKEMGEAPRIAELDRFVLNEFDLARGAAQTAPKPDGALAAEADDLFRTLVKAAG